MAKDSALGWMAPRPSPPDAAVNASTPPLAAAPLSASSSMAADRASSLSAMVMPASSPSAFKRFVALGRTQKKNGGQMERLIADDETVPKLVVSEKENHTTQR